MNVQRMAVRTAALLILSGSAITSIWGQPGNQNTPDSPGGMPAGMSPGGGPGPSAKINYTPAIYVDEGVYVPEKSVAASLSGGKVGNTSASGVKITSKADSFNGIYVKGSKSVFTLSDSTIELYGNGVNHADNYGAGAGAVAGSGGTLILKNVKITTNGLGSCTATSTDKGILKVYDSTLIANGGILPPGSPAPGTSPLAWGPPAPLGIGGNARASNTTSGSKSYFYNSTIIAEEWGALSTDETGGGVYLEANNCDIRTIKNGYGTYADGGATVVINDSKMSTATYLAIIAGPGKVTLNNVNATSGGNAVMLHNVGGNPAEVGVLEIKGGKIVTQKPVILVRSASPEITIDGTELASTSGVLIQSVINPDPHAARVKGQSDLKEDET
jgi:hypothetical protein